MPVWQIVNILLNQVLIFFYQQQFNCTGFNPWILLCLFVAREIWLLSLDGDTFSRHYRLPILYIYSFIVTVL